MKDSRAVLRRLRSLVPFRDGEGNPTSIILGTGRSGTTWLAEQLAEATGGRILFEPLHPSANPGRAWVGKRTYLRPDDPAPEWRAVFDAILSGRLRSRWTDRYNHRLAYRARIVKVIRGNLMLGWLARTYPGIPISLVIRDPVAVALSQLAGAWPIEIQRFLAQPDLVADYPAVAALAADPQTSQFRLNVLHWAVENHVALQQARAAQALGAQVRVYRYGALRDDPEQFRDFLRFNRAPATEEAMRHLRRPSRVSRPPSRRAEPAPEDVAYAAGVARAFGLADYLDAPAQERAAG